MSTNPGQSDSPDTKAARWSSLQSADTIPEGMIPTREMRLDTKEAKELMSSGQMEEQAALLDKSLRDYADVSKMDSLRPEGLPPEADAALAANDKEIQLLTHEAVAQAMALLEGKTLTDEEAEEQALLRFELSQRHKEVPKEDVRSDYETEPDPNVREANKFNGLAREMSEAILGQLEADRLKAEQENDPIELARAERRIEAEQRRAQQEQILLGEIDTSQPMKRYDGANGVLQAKFESGDRAAYKPKRLENELANQAHGVKKDRAYLNEFRASQVDRALHLDVIATAVVRSGPELKQGIGSLQYWENEDRTSTDAWFETGEQEQLQRLAVFDYITHNGDRHGSNALKNTDGKIRGIDNGYAFAASSREDWENYVRDQGVTDPDSVEKQVALLHKLARRAVLMRKGLFRKETKMIADLKQQIHDTKDSKRAAEMSRQKDDIDRKMKSEIDEILNANTDEKISFILQRKGVRNRTKINWAIKDLKSPGVPLKSMAMEAVTKPNDRVQLSPELKADLDSFINNQERQDKLKDFFVETDGRNDGERRFESMMGRIREVAESGLPEYMYPELDIYDVADKTVKDVFDDETQQTLE